MLHLVYYALRDSTYVVNSFVYTVCMHIHIIRLLYACHKRVYDVLHNIQQCIKCTLFFAGLECTAVNVTM